MPRQNPSRKSAALSRLKVCDKELASAPDITSILKETRGGIKMAFKAMRFSESELIIKFLDKYDALPEVDRDRVPIEAIALAAKIDIRHLWGEIMLAMRELSVHNVKVIAVAAHPDIIKSRVAYAQTPGGFRDRDALDTMLGALPSPKGPTFINKFFASGARDIEETPEQAEELVDDLDFAFPNCEVMQEKVQPMRQKALTAGK